MSKDKNWLKEQIKYEEVELKYAFDNYEQYEKVLIADDVNDLINQLEGPEQEKVVVPLFVGDWIEEERNSDTSYVGAMLRFYNFELPEKIKNYMNENYETFARAWLDGYSVEKEKLWAIERYGNYIGSYIIETGGVDVDYEAEKVDAFKFTDKSKAEAVALLINGTVEEITK